MKMGGKQPVFHGKQSTLVPKNLVSVELWFLQELVIEPVRIAANSLSVFDLLQQSTAGSFTITPPSGELNQCTVLQSWTNTLQCTSTWMEATSRPVGLEYKHYKLVHIA